VLLALVWGSSFILIKKALIAFQPIEVATLRIGIAALAFSPFFLTQRIKVERKDWRALLVVSLCGSGIPAFCYALAQTEISSITTGILNSLTPLFTLLIGLLFFQIRSHWMKYFGVLFGLLGAVLLIYYGESDTLQTDVLFASFIIVGTICYALSGNVVKMYLNHRNSFTISVLSITVLGPPALVVLFQTEFLHAMATHPQAWHSFLAVSILSLAGTVAASILYFKLVQITNALFAASVSYLIPMVAVVLGILDGEPLVLVQILGMLLIVCGVYLSRQ